MNWKDLVDAAITDLNAAKKDELQPIAHVQDAIDNLRKAIDAYDEEMEKDYTDGDSVA